MSADRSYGLVDQAEAIQQYVGVWHEHGYENPPMPECKTIPPLGERSANAANGGHDAIRAIDDLCRQLNALRDQLVSELRQDSDISAARWSRGGVPR